MARYHDLEWGQGGRDETSLFERLSLEAFQAGLSWRIVLERRDALREAFAAFVPARVAGFGAADVARLLADPRIIRNHAKIDAVIENARLLMRLHGQGVHLGTLTDAALARTEALPGPVPPRPPSRRADVPTSTAASTRLARDLRHLGWRSIGPTTAYAYLQAAGWVDDHLLGCCARRVTHGGRDHDRR